MGCADTRNNQNNLEVHRFIIIRIGERPFRWLHDAPTIFWLKHTIQRTSIKVCSQSAWKNKREGCKQWETTIQKETLDAERDTKRKDRKKSKLVQRRACSFIFVLFVQPMKGSTQKRKYEDVISTSQCKVKVVKRAENSIKKELQKWYPFEKDKCVYKEVEVVGGVMLVVR